MTISRSRFEADKFLFTHNEMMTIIVGALAHMQCHMCVWHRVQLKWNSSILPRKRADLWHTDYYEVV